MARSRNIMWIVLAAVLLTYLHYMIIDVPKLPARQALHEAILVGDAEPPYNGRLLVPTVVGELAEKIGFLWAYVVYELLAIAAMLLVIYTLCVRQTDDNTAIIMTMIAAASIATTFGHHYFQPWSLLEPTLLGLAILILKDFWREPTAVIVGWVILALAIIFNRYLTGGTHTDWWRLVGHEKGNGTQEAIAHVAFWHVIPFFVIAGMRRVGKWALLLLFVPVYLWAYAASNWIETRPMMTLLPVVIPIAAAGYRRMRWQTKSSRK